MSIASESRPTRLAAILMLGRRAGGTELAHGFWVMLDQAVVSLASFLATVIVGRACGRHDLGVYGLATSIFWLVAGIPNALVWTPYTSRAAKMSPPRRARYAGSVTGHVLLIALAIAAAMPVIGMLPIPGMSENAWFTPMCVALAPFIIMMFFREHLRRINLADLRVRELIAVDAPIAIVQLLLLLGLARAGYLTAITALWTIAAACGMAVVWAALHRERFEFDRRSAKTHWIYNQQFGRWLLYVSIAWLLGDASYRWLVGTLHGIESLGQFAAAQSIVLAINPLLLAVGNLAQALSANTYAQGGIRELRRLALRGTLIVGVCVGTALAALAIVGGPAVHVIFGAEYAGLNRVVAALCLGMFANSLLMPIDAAMVALRRGRAMSIAATVRLVVAIGGGVALIGWLGLEGVGYTMALSCSCAAIVQWAFFLQGNGDAER